MLRAAGVDVKPVRACAGSYTSQTLIVNVAGQDRRFIHTFGANGEFRAADIPLERLASCRVLYLGGYLLLPHLQQEEVAAVFAAARARGVRTVLDVDGSGGGDAFDAGYIYGLLRGLEPIECLRVASALGASCVRAIGTTPGVFTRAECEAFLRDNDLKIERLR